MTALSTELLKKAMKNGKLVQHKEEIIYYRFREDFLKIPRGTVIVPSNTAANMENSNFRIIHGYPHIPRILTLSEGIKKNFNENEKVYIEEKIDGFNVRIASVTGSVIAFSRGGFIDQFSTEKFQHLKHFFDDYPKAVLCAEVVGNTPYTHHKKETEEASIFVFDVDRGDGTYLSCDKKLQILSDYEIPPVPLLGIFSSSETDKIKNLAIRLHRSKKEGMVMKSEDRVRVLKYVTAFADIEDIRTNSHLLFDMPAGFFIQRLLRSAIFIRDFGLDRERYAKELGAAFYERLLEAISSGEKNVFEEYEIFVKSNKTWEKILLHMSREVKIEIIFMREEKDGIRIRFKKIYKRTTRKICNVLSGKKQVD